MTRNAELVAASLQAPMTPLRADIDYRPEEYAWTDDYAIFFRALR